MAFFGYRYAFNGKEQDPSWNGVGNMYDYGFRIYDPRIARFSSVDPLTHSFPYWSPYQFAANTPIMAIDLDGLEYVIVIRNGTGSESMEAYLQDDKMTSEGLLKKVAYYTKLTHTQDGVDWMHSQYGDLNLTPESAVGYITENSKAQEMYGDGMVVMGYRKDDAGNGELYVLGFIPSEEGKTIFYDKDNPYKTRFIENTWWNRKLVNGQKYMQDLFEVWGHWAAEVLGYVKLKPSGEPSTGTTPEEESQKKKVKKGSGGDVSENDTTIEQNPSFIPGHNKNDTIIRNKKTGEIISTTKKQTN